MMTWLYKLKTAKAAYVREHSANPTCNIRLTNLVDLIYALHRTPSLHFSLHSTIKA
jgi:hypothetical protein